MHCGQNFELPLEGYSTSNRSKMGIRYYLLGFSKETVEFCFDLAGNVHAYQLLQTATKWLFAPIYFGLMYNQSKT